MKSLKDKPAGLLLMLAVLLWSKPARADVLVIEGAVNTFAERIDGQSVSLLSFSIPLLRSGAGLTVVTATVDWEHGGITANQRVLVEARDASLQLVRSPLAPLSESTVGEVLATPAAQQLTWHPRDYRRLGKCLFRFDLTTEVTELVGSPETTLQLLVSSEEVSPEALGTSARAPLLTIRYGFLGELPGGSEGE